jgi:hypothetical protein
MILLTTNNGITFERTDYVKRSKVTVKSCNNTYLLRAYRFDNIKETFTSPYISWENLNCCGGWFYDDQYLNTAVQNGKKLCAGLILKSSDEAKYLLENKDINFYSDFKNDRYYLEIARKGCLKDYYNIQEVLNLYKLHGIYNLNMKRIEELCSAEMISLMKDNNPYNYDYANPFEIEDLIITGLLLGYPIESTIAIIYE